MMTFDEYCEIIDKSNFMIDSSNPYDMKIMNALKKDVKEKLTDVHSHNSVAGVLFGDCPICKAIVVNYKNYCDNCGQAIDWSDDNDTKSEES